MVCSAAVAGDTAGELFICAAAAVPALHYVATALAVAFVVLYNFLEFHFIGDLIRGLRGDPVNLTFNINSHIYHGVVSKCRALHGRYLATPWLASPHFQTAFLNFFGRPPVFTYRRQLYTVHDGGTIALDWLLASDVAGGSVNRVQDISKDDITPIVVVIPGLTSDSVSSYLKHLAYGIAKRGWNVVISNHRGLGGISITSDSFYNAGWTEDIREVLRYLHQKYPKSTLFAVGTSIGANILVKYLGEDGEDTPVAGAAAVCSPWDLLVCDRFINRKLVQRFYDRVLTIGLQGYAQLHQTILDRLANWDGIRKARTVRDFDNHATRLLAKYETVDTYYRRCSCVTYVEGVSVPLLCISALDDPVCTREAIPWDECRANKNIVLATTAHGGHLAFFQGIGACSLWWVGAVSEYLGALYSSEFMHQQTKDGKSHLRSSLESTIDKSPYVDLMEDGIIAAVETDHNNLQNSTTDQFSHNEKPNKQVTEVSLKGEEASSSYLNEPAELLNEQAENSSSAKLISDLAAPLTRSMNQLSRQSKKSMWLLVYMAFVTTCPVLASALLIAFRKKWRDVLPAWLRS